MSSPKAGAHRALTKRLRDSLTVLVAMLLIAIGCLAWQVCPPLQHKLSSKTFPGLRRVQCNSFMLLYETIIIATPCAQQYAPQYTYL